MVYEMCEVAFCFYWDDICGSMTAVGAAPRLGASFLCQLNLIDDSSTPLRLRARG